MQYRTAAGENARPADREEFSVALQCFGAGSNPQSGDVDISFSSY